MIFGIWPGVATADLISLQPLDCPAEDTAKTLDALRQLQGTAREFYVRAYRHFGLGFRPRGTAVDVAACGGGKVQVGEELNMPAPLDGGSPGAFEAIGAGVAAALDERDRHEAPVLVGVNSAGPPDPAFWNRLAGAIGPHNTRRLDYIGLDVRKAPGSTIRKWILGTSWLRV